MTAPLYDVKARLSEYITYAENGEIVEITKHGTVSAVIISKKDFDENYKKSVKKNPVEELRKWRAGLSKDELLVLAEAGEEYNRILEENRNAERLDFGKENSWG